MSEISTREEFKDLLSGMTDLSDYDDAIAAYDAQAARIAELEAAAEEARSDYAQLSRKFGPLVVERAELQARIAELEEMVRAAAQRIEELTLAARIKELEENE